MSAVTAVVSDVLGEPFYIEGNAFIEAVTAVATRNAVIFVGGDVDDDFWKQVGKNDDHFSVDTKDVLNWIDALVETAHTIDEAMVDRFHLPVGELFSDSPGVN